VADNLLRTGILATSSHTSAGHKGLQVRAKFNDNKQLSIQRQDASAPYRKVPETNFLIRAK
jgi:hypothetical protein